MTAISSWKQVYFEPWIGHQYGDLWGKRLLIVGESHYDEWSEEGEPAQRHNLPRDMTSICVRELVDGIKGARYWTHISNRVGGSEHINDRPGFWNRVAFYNFVQSPVRGGPGARPSSSQFEAGKAALSEVLRTLLPDRVIFTGLTLGSYLPSRDGRCMPIIIGDKRLEVGYYVESGKKLFTCITGHPRGRYFPTILVPLLKEFIVSEPQLAQSEDI